MQRFIGKRGITGAENEVGGDFGAYLGLQRGGDIDLCQDAKALSREDFLAFGSEMRWKLAS